MKPALTDPEFHVRRDWLNQTLAKLDGLSQLRPDWDSHGGLPLVPEIHAAAVRQLSALGEQDWPLPAVVLGSAGTVQLEWRAQGRELEVEFLPGESLGYLKVHPDGRMEEGQVEGQFADTFLTLVQWLIHG